MTDSPDGGRCYEDFNVGMLIKHPLGRTVTAADQELIRASAEHYCDYARRYREAAQRA